MAKQRKSKDPFELLPSEYKDAINGMSVQEIKERIYKVAVDNAALKEAKKADQDLKDKQETVKEASAVYREGFKVNDLKIRYAKLVLEGKGGA